MSSLSLLETLVKECRVVSQSQHNRATVEWMRAKYHALALKIRSELLTTNALVLVNSVPCRDLCEQCPMPGSV